MRCESLLGVACTPHKGFPVLIKIPSFEGYLKLLVGIRDAWAILYRNRVCVANVETSVFRFGLELTIHDAWGIHIRSRACVANVDTL